MNFLNRPPIERIDIKKVWFIILSLIATFPLIPKAVESILMFLFFLFSTVLFFKTERKFNSKEVIKVFIFSSVFVVYLVSSLYSSNKIESLNFLIITLPIFLFSLSFCILTKGKVSRKQFEIIKNIFIFSTLISLFITHVRLELNSSDTITNWEYRNLFESFTKVHGTYFSIWIGLSIIFLLSKINQKIILKKYHSFLFLILVAIYFIYWQYLIAARLPTFITSLLVLSFIFLKIKNKLKFYFLFLVSLLFLAFFLIKFDEIQTKFKFGIPQGRYDLKHLEMTSEEIRTGIYYCSIKILSNDIILGVGIGDVNDKLNSCYKKDIPSNVYQIFPYNSHNQYMQLALSGGILGLFLFLINVFYILKSSFLKKDILYIFFNILVFVCFLTENILSRHDGVIFYSYFSILFYKLTKKSI